jgi:signal transduction histidine kinase
MEMCESLELRGTGESGAFAALQFVRRRFDLRIVPDAISQAEELHPVEDGVSAPVHGARVARAMASELIAEGAGLAHDVGNLLGALSLYADLLSSPGVLHEAYREYASDLRLLTDRSTEMVSRLMQHAENRSQPTEEDVTVLPDVLRRMRGLLRNIAGCAVEIELGEGSSQPVMAPRDVVERVVANLVKNAGEAMDHDLGAISIWVGDTAGRDGGRVAVRVCDNGCGMSEAQLGSLGGPKRSTGGRGIGFRVVRELVEMSGGVLGVASAPGEGTMVEVEWRVQTQPECGTADGEAHTRTRGAVTRTAAGWIRC